MTFKVELTVPKVADKSIVVYKIMGNVQKWIKYPEKLTYNKYRPFCREMFIYDENVPTKKVDIEVKIGEIYPTFEIYEGYHSYNKLPVDKAVLYKKSLGIPVYLVKCEIPPNTKYYENEYNEIVSESLVAREVVNI